MMILALADVVPLMWTVASAQIVRMENTAALSRT